MTDFSVTIGGGGVSMQQMKLMTRFPVTFLSIIPIYFFCVLCTFLSTYFSGCSGIYWLFSMIMMVEAKNYIPSKVSAYYLD